MRREYQSKVGGEGAMNCVYIHDLCSAYMKLCRGFRGMLPHRKSCMRWHLF